MMVGNYGDITYLALIHAPVRSRIQSEMSICHDTGVAMIKTFVYIQSESISF